MSEKKPTPEELATKIARALLGTPAKEKGAHRASGPRTAGQKKAAARKRRA